MDAVSALELGRANFPDSEHLAYAAGEGRCVITQDRRDFVRLAQEYARDGRTHSGVLVVPTSLRNNQFGPIVDTILQYQSDHPDGMPLNSVDYLRR